MHSWPPADKVCGNFCSGGIDDLVEQLNKRGIHMSDAGGIVKVSADASEVPQK